VRYGDHPRNVLDFYRANSNEPTPVVIYFHGGGFSQGDKSDVNNSTLCRRCLDMGISVVSANYRFVIGENAEPFPGPMHDGARVVQFVRFMASEWGIDPERVVLAGASAGACLSIWLAVHDDLAEPESEDPVEKLSTRVSGVIAYGGQTFLDPNLILEKVGGTPDIHRSILPFYGVETMAELDKPEVQALIHDASAINHVSPDDPPLQLRYKGGLGDIPLPEDAPGSDSIHHPFFGKVMQEKYRSAGLVCDFFCADERGSRNELEFLKFCFASHR